jgi:hypothetical protein
MTSGCQAVADLLIDNAGPLAREAFKLATTYETAAQAGLSQDAITGSENAFVDTYGRFQDDALRLTSQISEGSCKVSGAALSEVQASVGDAG